MVKSLIGLILGLILMYVFVNVTDDVDSVSSATSVVASSNKGTKLPKSSPDYSISKIKGLQNFVVTYSNTFTRGGLIESIEGAEALKKWGIETLISMVPSDLERALTKQLGITLVELDFDKQTLTPEVLKTFTEAIKASKSSYLHCHGGVHRAGSLAIVYRVMFDGWEFDRALNEFVALGGHPIKDADMLAVIKTFLKDQK